MQPTITWKPVQLLCRNHVDGKDDVVIRIVYAVLAERGGLSGRSIGEIDIEYDPASFTAFSDLSEEQVLAWLLRAVGRNGIALRQQEAVEQLLMAEAVAENLTATQTTQLIPRGLPWQRREHQSN